MTDQTVEFIEKTYDMAILKFNEKLIPGKGIKFSGKWKRERIKVDNAKHGVGWKTSDEEYSGELSDIPYKYWDDVQKIIEELDSNPLALNIACYNIIDDGEYEERGVLRYATITDFDSTAVDGTFGIKFEALLFKH